MIVQLPALTKRKVVPLTVQIALVPEVKLMPKPEVAVATKGAGVLSMVWIPGSEKAMVCVVCVTAGQEATTTDRRS